MLHKNVKEILSKILSIVSSQGINVAHMLDQSKGDYAYLILELDDVPGTASIDLIRSMPDILRVRLI